MWEPEERLQQEYISAERERDFSNEDLRDWSQVYHTNYKDLV